MKTELSKASPITLLTALALQSRSDSGTKPVTTESVIDECVKLGQKHSLPASLWKPVNPQEVGVALNDLQLAGHAMYVQGKRWLFGPCPLSVPATVKLICDRPRPLAFGPKIVDETRKHSPISRQRKRDTCAQLARLVHPEIATVLDAILTDELS